MLAEDYDVAAERILIGQGSLQLLDLFARLLIRPGNVVYAEAPTYDRTLTILRRAGADIVGFPLAEDGLDVDAVAARLEAGERPAFFYVIPDFQNPSGTVMSRKKRERLVELARAYDVWLVEDAPYRSLRYRGIDLPALFDLAPERVLQLSSFSKLISPGLRVGYAVTPDPMAGPLAKMAEDTYINTSYVTQAMVHEFVRRGWMNEQLARLKALYAPRLDALLDVLEARMGDLATWPRPDGGFFVGLTLTCGVEATTLRERARTTGLLLSDGHGFFADGRGTHFIRLPFCALTPDTITLGIERLTDVLRTLLP
jgi:DNA-binding transcriptional MocR family regulator